MIVLKLRIGRSNARAMPTRRLTAAAYYHGQFFYRTPDRRQLLLDGHDDLGGVVLQRMFQFARSGVKLIVRLQQSSPGRFLRRIYACSYELVRYDLDSKGIDLGRQEVDARKAVTPGKIHGRAVNGSSSDVEQGIASRWGMVVGEESRGFRV